MKDLGLRAKLARITGNNSGMAVVEVVLLIVEKPNAKHRYVLCGK